MKVIYQKDLILSHYENVIQVSFIVSEEVKELDMPQETIIHIIQKENGIKTKRSILCDTSTILTIQEETSAVTS